MRKIKFVPNGGYFIVNDDSHYWEPYNSQYYVEAITVLDAMIDSALIQLALVYEQKPVPIYDKNGKQNKWRFYAGLLRRKKALSNVGIDFIQKFKDRRNLMAHNREGEFALIIKTPIRGQVKSSKEMVSKMQEQVKIAMEDGDGILNQLRYMFTEKVHRDQENELKRKEAMKGKR